MVEENRPIHQPGGEASTHDVARATHTTDNARLGGPVLDSSKSSRSPTDSLQSADGHQQPGAETPRPDAAQPDAAKSDAGMDRSAGLRLDSDQGRADPTRPSAPAAVDRLRTDSEHGSSSATDDLGRHEGLRNTRKPQKTEPPGPGRHDDQQAAAAQHHESAQHTGESHHAEDGLTPGPRDHTGHSPTAEGAPTPEVRTDQSDESDTNKGAQTFMLLCTEYSAKKGGVVVFNRALAEGLADAGQNVVVRIGEDASPYADLERPNLHIVGPKDLPPPTVGADGRKVEPNSRDFLGPEHDPEDMPEHVDYVVGHTRFSGPDAKAERDANYPDAKLIHFVHMVPEALGRVKENGDPPEANEAAKGVENHIIERDLVADADLAAGVGPAITENVREMVTQAHDLESRGGKPVATQAVHELIPGMEFRDRGERSTGGRPLKVLLFGRTDVGQKGGVAAAEVVSRLRDEGQPVELVVRGVPADKVTRQKLYLGQIMDGADVEVRPFTVERADLHADFDDADVMIMTSRAEGFGLTAQEAAAAGVPVVVPSGSGFGRWLGESGQFSAELTGPSIVEQGFEDQVPVDAWVDTLRNVVQDYPAAQQRALDLQQAFKDRQVTWGTAVGSLIEEAENLR